MKAAKNGNYSVVQFLIMRKAKVKDLVINWQFWCYLHGNFSFRFR